MESTIIISRKIPTALNFTIKALLFSGVAASWLYAAMIIFIPLMWAEYNSQTQTVSELSAIGAPTRDVWIQIGLIYTLLMTAFGYGVFLSAHKSRPLRFIGLMILIYGIIGIYWPPMHLRGEPTTLTDTLHIVWTIMTVLLMTTTISVGATTFDRRFKYYSAGSVVLLLVFGLLTTTEAPDVPRNLPTPWIGVWERINIGVFLLWIIALSATVQGKLYSRAKKFTSKRTDRAIA